MIICKECNVCLESMDSYKAHIIGKRHQKNLELLEEEKSKLKHQAYISWKKGVNKNDVESFISTFGLIKCLYVNNDQKYAIVDFEQAESCSKFLSNDKYKLKSGMEILVDKRLNINKKRPASSLNDSPRSTTNSSHSPSKSTKKARMLADPPSKTPNSSMVDQSIRSPHKPLCSSTAGSKEAARETGLVDDVIEAGMRNMWKSRAHHGSDTTKGSPISTNSAPHSTLSTNQSRPPTVINDKNFLRSGTKQQIASPNAKKDVNVKKDGNVKKEKPNVEVNQISMEIVQKLMQSKSVDGQMTKLVESIQLQKSDVDSRHKLAEQLRTIARSLPDLQEAKVYIFGSSSNGMGIRGCDLDLILNVNSEMDTTKLMKMMKKRLHYCQRPVFKDILIIPSKRCPIIRFYCPSLDLKCDLSFFNRLAIRNTEVLRHLSLNVPQFRVLSFVLRKWMDSVEVGGNVSGGPKMTHYALYMLVWFYIRSKFNLPSFENLSILCDKEYIDQWDCTFPFNLPQLIQVNKHLFSLQGLLIDFFDFFKDLDFKDKVLSIRSGKIISFDEMEKLEQFKKSDIMVQDPFLLEHNITQNITNLILTRLQNACKEASSICALASFKERPDNPNAPWGIILLLNQKPQKDVIIPKPVRPRKGRIYKFKINRTLKGPKCLLGTKSIPASIAKPYQISGESISVEVKYVPILVNDIVSVVGKVLQEVYLVKIDSIRCRPYKKEESCLKDGELLSENTSDMYHTILTDASSCPVVQTNSSAENLDKSKVNSNFSLPNHYKNVAELTECMLQFDCISTLRTWLARSKYKKYVNNVEMSPLDKEVLVTLKMLELIPKPGEKSNMLKEMEGCHIPFLMNIEVRKIEEGHTLVVFHAIPNKPNSKELGMEFQHLINSLETILQHAMKSL